MMTPGPVEEAGKATSLFMEIMRSQPLSLALVIMNVMLLALFYFVAKTVGENRRHEFELLQESQRETQKLLYNCVPSGSRTNVEQPQPPSSEK